MLRPAVRQINHESFSAVQQDQLDELMAQFE